MATAPGAKTPPVAPDSKQRPFKVRATQLGYYDHIRRREGDVFVVSGERAFSAKWMERVDSRTPDSLTTGSVALRRAHDELVSGKTPRQGTSFADESSDNPLGA